MPSGCRRGRHIVKRTTTKSDVEEYISGMLDINVVLIDWSHVDEDYTFDVYIEEKVIELRERIRKEILDVLPFGVYVNVRWEGDMERFGVKR